MPQSIDLFVYRSRSSRLIAKETSHDTRIEGLAQHLVYKRVFLVDISSEQQTRTDEFAFAVRVDGIIS